MALEPTNVSGVTAQWDAPTPDKVSVLNSADDGNIGMVGQDCLQCGAKSSADDTICLHCGTSLEKNMLKEDNDKDRLGNGMLKSDPILEDDVTSQEETHSSPTASEDARGNIASRSAHESLGQTMSNSSLLSSGILRANSMSNVSRDEKVNSLDRLWAPNNSADNCHACGDRFGINRRKHHCRACGMIFCSKCTNNKIVLPGDFGYGKSPQRCCAACDSKIKNQIIRSPADVFALRRGGPKKQSTAHLNPSQSFVHQVMEQIAHASSSDFVDHYAALGVKQDATSSEINAQFRKLVQVVQEAERLRAEGNTNIPAPPVSFKDLNRSFNVLRDTDSRAQFDNELEQIRIAATKKLREDAGDVVKTKPMSRDCQVCFRPFTSFRRRHHCRRCGSSVCDACSPDKRPVPEFGVNTPQRVCKNCVAAPPKLRRMIINIAALPLQGYEYLQTLELKSRVISTSNPETFIINTGFEAASKRYSVTETEAEILKSYCLETRRTIRHFEWLHRQMSAVMPMSSLPPLPGKLNLKNLGQARDVRVNKKNVNEYQGKLESYLRAVVTHPVLGDLVEVKAFLGMNNSDFNTFVERSQTDYGRDYLENFGSLEKWLRFRLEQEQVRVRIQQAQRRVTAVSVRLTAGQARENRQSRRRDAQIQRHEPVVNGSNVVEEIKKKQAERISREQERFHEQDSTDTVLFIDREADDKDRQMEAADVAEKKEQYVHRKNNWLNEMEEWQADMSAWTTACSQRTAQASPRAGLAVNDWLLKHTSLPWMELANECAQPQALQLMRQTMESLEAEEPEKLSQEQQLSTQEWSHLVEEETRLKDQRVYFEKEDRLWTEWDVAAEREAALISAETSRRKEKEAAIEASLSKMELDIQARRSNQKKRWEHLNQREKKLLDGEQELHKRLENYQARAENQQNLKDEINRRSKLELFRLEGQKKEQRILRFIRDAEDEARNQAYRVLEKDNIALANSLSDYDLYRPMLPEALEASEVDLMIEATEMQEVERGNPRSMWEKADEAYDPRDNFMNNIKKRRENIDKKLTEEKDELSASSNRCRQLMARIQFMAQQFDLEGTRVREERETLNQLQDMLETEEQFVREEKEIREFKIKTLDSKLSETSSTVEALTHRLTTRNKEAADRATRQAVTIERLKKMLGETTKRIDNRQTGVMHTDKRQDELQQRLETLSTDDVWYKGITLNSGVEFDAHRIKLNEGVEEHRGFIAEIQSLSEINPLEERSCEGALMEREEDKRVLASLLPTLFSVEAIFGTEMSAVLDNEDIPLTDRFRQHTAQIRVMVEKLQAGLNTEDNASSIEASRLDTEKVAISDLQLNLQREKDLIALENQNLNNENVLLEQERQKLVKRCDDAAVMYANLRDEHDKLMADTNRMLAEYRKTAPPPSRAAVIAKIRDTVLMTERRSDAHDLRGMRYAGDHSTEDPSAPRAERRLLDQIKVAHKALRDDEGVLAARVQRGQQIQQDLILNREKILAFSFDDDIYSRVMAFVNGMAPSSTLLASMPWLEELQALRTDVIQRRQQHLKHLDQETRLITSDNLRLSEALQEVVHQQQELLQLKETVNREAQLWQVHHSELTTSGLRRADNQGSERSFDADNARSRAPMTASNYNSGRALTRDVEPSRPAPARQETGRDSFEL